MSGRQKPEVIEKRGPYSLLRWEFGNETWYGIRRAGGTRRIACFAGSTKDERRKTLDEAFARRVLNELPL